VNCICGSEIETSNCCARFIDNKEQPSTAEELMRARFTAYAQVKMDFIEQTHNPKLKKELDMDENREWAEKTKWLELQVFNTENGGPDDDEGVVEFKAKFDAGEGEQWHQERSFFNKIDGNWYFTDSKNPQQTTFVRSGEKVGRNDPCPCDSGKKYKKCCG
jgi:SEC-C motif domain protein